MLVPDVRVLVVDVPAVFELFTVVPVVVLVLIVPVVVFVVIAPVIVLVWCRGDKTRDH